MANILPDIGSGLVAKLEKDELYTFLHGFGVGLIYYLIIFMHKDVNNCYILNLSTVFEKIAVYICLGLLSTLVVYTLYVLISMNVGRYAQSKLNDKNSGFQKIDISERRIFLFLLYDRFCSQYQSSLHLRGLQISALIILSPVPWIFSHFINPLHAAVNAMVSVIFLVASLLLIYGFKNSFIDYLKVDHLVAYKMIKITNNVDEYVKNHNDLVNQYAVIEAQNKK